MITFKRTVYNDPDFLLLVEQLDEDLKDRYHSYQDNFTLLNKLDNAVKVMIAFDGDKAIACGALRPMAEDNTAELKRMFVIPACRGKGISTQMLQALETWALQQNYVAVRLETGNKQPEAIALYLKHGYIITEPFGGYKNIPEAICMKKIIADG